MKTSAFALLTIVATAALSGCGGGSATSTPPTQPPAAVVTGVDTPKSVAVVTAT